MRLFFIILCFFSSALFAQDKCDNAFRGSKLYYENQAIKEQRDAEKLHPKNEDPIHEIHLSKKWNNEPDTPHLIKSVLPKDVFFIENQQFQPQSRSVVKVSQVGDSVIARAEYSYKGTKFFTNVVFSVGALISNMRTEKKWLVGEDAKAGVLFLHGGGTNSTGAHTGSTMVTHFNKLGIDVLALDLSWHAQGHRRFLNFETEIHVLSAFAKKYIPPNVPLFVVGHSYGSVFAEKIMTMTDKPNFSFHKNLRGLVALSTMATGFKPGESLQQREKKFRETMDKARELIKQYPSSVAPAEKYIWEDVIASGKFSPLGGFASTANILQLTQHIPSHKGEKYTPTLVAVGKGDALVYRGHEKNYHAYYPKLANVEFHLIENARHLSDPKGPEQKVGHLLSDYIVPDGTSKTGYGNLQMKLIRDFINKQLQNPETALRKTPDIRLQIKSSWPSPPETALRKTPDISDEKGKDGEHIPAFIRIVQNFANDFSFRKFLNNFIYYAIGNTTYSTSFRDRGLVVTKELQQILHPFSTNIRRAAGFILKLSEMNKEGGLLDQQIALQENLQALKKSRRTKQENKTQKELISKSKTMRDKMKELKELADILQEEMIYLSDPKVLETLKSPHVEDVMQKLQKVFEEYKKDESGILLARFNDNTKHEVRRFIEKADEILQTKNDRGKDVMQILENEIQSLKEQKGKSLVSEKILKASNIKEAIQILNEYKIPNQVRDQALPRLEEHFVIKDILAGQYIPPVSKMGVRADSTEKSHDKQRIIDDVKHLEDVIAEKQELHKLRTELNNKLKKLTPELHSLSEKVSSNISKIKLTMVTLSTEPPHSLKQAVKDLEDMFNNQLEPALLIMEKSMDKLSAETFANKQVLNDNEVIGHLKTKQAVIDNFSTVFQHYLQTKKEINRMAITAMEAGEKGQEAQNAVLAVYGKGSKGKYPLLGSESIYLQLQKMTEDVAKLESELITIERLIYENSAKYNSLLDSVAKLVLINNNERSDYQVLRQAANTEKHIAQSVMDILNFRGSTKEAEKIKIEEELHIFEGTINHWNKMKSTHPKDLPTQ